MRVLSSRGAAALASPVPPLCLLVRMDLPEPVFAATAGANIEWGGHTWLGVALVGSIDAIVDSMGERNPLRFTLSNVPNEVLGLALESARVARGKRCRVWLAIHDPETYELLDVLRAWSGSIDQMVLAEGGEQPTGSVTVTAEHRAVTFGRPKPVRYTDADQRRLYPGDKSLQYIVSQSTHQDVWPAAAWFKK